MQKSVFILLTFLTLQSYGQGLGLVKADKLKDWRIDQYTIIYSRKLGPAGPPYYQYDIYKGDKYLSYAAYIIDNDSCKLLFRERNDYYVTFNLCNSTKSILTADKTKLETSDIDSITIRPYDSVRLRPRDTYVAPFYDTIITKNFDSTITKRLIESQVETFVRKWNSAKVNGFDRLGKGYHYLVTVYAKDYMRKFRTLNFFITENGLWSYEMKEDNFFDKIWYDNK
jgi:hypothetical protein